MSNFDERHLKIAKVLGRERKTLRQLRVGIGVIREMKERGYNIKSQTEDGKTYYFLHNSPDKNFLVHSGRTADAQTFGLIRTSDWHGGSAFHKKPDFAGL